MGYPCLISPRYINELADILAEADLADISEDEEGEFVANLLEKIRQRKS